MLPAGDYQLRFEDVQTRLFVVIQDVKRHEDVAFIPAMTVGEGQGTSALLIATEGNQWVVQSLRLSKLGVVFNYEPTLVRGTKGIDEAHTLQALPVTEAKK